MWSQAKDTEIHGGTFTDVNRDYNHTTYLQFFNLNGSQATDGFPSSVLDGSVADVLEYFTRLHSTTVEARNTGHPNTVDTQNNAESPGGQASTVSIETIHTPESQVLRQSLTVPVALDDAVKLQGQKLNWRESIVDLMKVLKTDSTYAARKQLAVRWRYSGDMADSASMNIWLHRYIIKLLEANKMDLDAVQRIIKAAS